MYTMESFIAEPVSVAADGSMVPTTIVASDGFPVAATRYLTRGSSEGVVLIAPGAWFRQCTYEKFARYLASRGLEAVTWDWRGIGNSKYEAGRRDRRLSMRAWAWQDYEAMLLWGSKRAGTRPLVLVAHAFGGQALGLAASAPLVRRAVFVAAPEVAHVPSGRLPRWTRRALWHAGVPMLTRLFGGLPLSLAGNCEDLPAGVARDLARWSRSPGYFGHWEGHARLSIPLLSYSFSDDPIAPSEAVEALLRRYSGAQRQHRLLRPPAGSRRRDAHCRFFQEGMNPGVWESAADFLLAST